MKNIYFKKQKTVGNLENVFQYVGNSFDLKDGALMFHGINLLNSVFEFNEIEFPETFKFSKYFFLKKTITFKKCKFLKNSISNIANANLTFSNCTFQSNIFNIENAVESSLYFYKSFHENLFISKIEKSNFIAIINETSKFYFSHIEDSQVTLGSDYIEDNEMPEIFMSFYDSELLNFNIKHLKIKELDFINTKINQFNLSDCIGNELLILNQETQNSCNFLSMNIENNFFTKIYIRGEFAERKHQLGALVLSHSQDVVIQNIHLKKVVLDGARNKDINFWNCDIEELEFNEFAALTGVDFGKVNLIGCSKLSIIGSSLNFVWFGPSFFHQVRELNFNNSSLVGVQLFNFKYFEINVIRNSKSSIDDKIDFTRELGFILNEQGNVQYARMYKALELELRRKQLNNSLTIVDKIIIGLNFWSNSHGTMPQKSLLWIFLLIIIQFGIINLDLALQTNLPYDAGFDFLSQNYSYFIKPFTFLTEVEEEYKLFHNMNLQVRFHPVTKFFDFLFKISYAYLLYQFIAAFRKFNK